MQKSRVKYFQANEIENEMRVGILFSPHCY